MVILDIIGLPEPTLYLLLIVSISTNESKHVFNFSISLVSKTYLSCCLVPDAAAGAALSSSDSFLILLISSFIVFKKASG